MSLLTELLSPLGGTTTEMPALWALLRSKLSCRQNRLSVSGFFVRRRAGTPVAFLPDIDIALLHPLAAQPDVARMRPRPPVAGHPDPLTAPVPVAGNEIPQRPWAGTHGNDILLIVRRRLGGLSEIDIVRRRNLWRDVGGRRRLATREQR